MSRLDLFSKPDTLDNLKRRIQDQITNSPKAGIGPSWFAEVIAEICVEINAINEKIADLQSNKDILAGLQLLEERLTPEGLILEANRPASESYKLVANELWDPADGFYSLEWTNEGVPFRWTGPHRTFRFLVNLDRRNPAELVLAVLFGHPTLEMAEVLCRVDGKLEPLQVRQGEQSQELHVVLPSKPGSYKVLVEFELPSMQPADPPDSRVLGFAVHSLVIGPRG